MTDAEDITEAIAAATAKPKRVRVEGMGESEEHNPKALVAAQQAVANARAANGANGFGLRFVKLNPPGAR